MSILPSSNPENSWEPTGSDFRFVLLVEGIDVPLKKSLNLPIFITSKTVMKYQRVRIVIPINLVSDFF